LQSYRERLAQFSWPAQAAACNLIVFADPGRPSYPTERRQWHKCADIQRQGAPNKRSSSKASHHRHSAAIVSNKNNTISVHVYLAIEPAENNNITSRSNQKAAALAAEP